MIAFISLLLIGIVALLVIIPSLAMPKKLSFSDIRTAVDKLPCAIYYGTRENIPILANNCFYELYFRMTGNPFRTISGFEQMLEARNCLMEIPEETLLEIGYFDKNPDSTLLKLDEEYWMVQCGRFEEECSYVLAYNVTLEMQSVQKLYQLNRDLESCNRHIEGQISDVVEYTRECEFDSRRNIIHSRFGECIYISKNYFTRLCMEEERDIEKEKQILQLLREALYEGTGREKEREKEREHEESMEELYMISEMVGCPIVICGELPMERHGHLILKTIREALINAIRHANASKLYVDASHYQDCGVIRIYDDGERKKDSISPGGGLTGIRDMLLHSGIVLRLETTPRFCMILDFQKCEDIQPSKRA